MVALNLLVGFLIVALLVASLIAPDWVMRGLGVSTAPNSPPPLLGLRLIMVVGILATPLTHVALTRLRDIVGMVSAGDPFVVENAVRLQQIAWAVLGLELLHLAVGVIRAIASLDLHWSVSPTPWLSVLLLFVLARVFRQGALMREELEGTV
ncbi:MAG: DUF2975 domain-containing protein [Gemmatimonadota bacterium]